MSDESQALRVCNCDRAPLRGFYTGLLRHCRNCGGYYPEPNLKPFAKVSEVEHQQPPPAQSNYLQPIEPIRTPQDMLQALKAEMDLADRHVVLNPGNNDMAAIASWTKSALVRLRDRVEAGQQPPPRQAALAILNRWQAAMDSPNGPPLENHHADLDVLRAALQAQQPQPQPHQEQHHDPEVCGCGPDAAWCPYQDGPPRLQQEQQSLLSPLAQALLDGRWVMMEEALRSMGVRSANLLMYSGKHIANAVRELLHHTEQQTLATERARVVGVLDGMIKRAREARANPDPLMTLAPQQIDAAVAALLDLRQRLSSGEPQGDGQGG